MSSGAVVVAGPKFCGKTTTCMLYQKSFVKLNTRQAIAMARMNPKGVLEGEADEVAALVEQVHQQALRIHHIFVIFGVIFVNGDLVGALLIIPHCSSIAEEGLPAIGGTILVALDGEVALQGLRRLAFFRNFKCIMELDARIGLILS